MMKKIYKAVTFLLSLLAAFSGVACGEQKSPSGSDPNGSGETVEITIYSGGSSEYRGKKGALEEEVYKYIEDTYYEQMGTRLKFNVQFMPQTMKNTIVTQVTEGTIDVVISHVGGGDGLDDWLLNQPSTLYRDMREDFLKYKKLGNMENWMWTDGENLTINALDRVRRLNGEMLGIPSVITPYKLGVLVRKDWMKECGYTDDETDTTRTLVNDYEDFEALALAMKEKYNLNYAVSGAIYEVEKTGLLGAYGLDAGYYSMTKTTDDKGNNIIDYGAQINTAYAEVLAVESRWVQNGVLAVAPDAIKVNECEEQFIAGSTGIFLQNGTVEHLIEVARACKEQNPEAEFTVLSGLTKDESSTAKGAMRNAVGTFMASITANTPDYKELLTFLNWVYSSEENYNLCRYGKEGVHWIDNGDGTYSYPAGYSYQNKPYSGILTLVENQAISNLQYKDFTEEEKKWITNVRKPENYIINDTVDYLLIINDADLMKTHFNKRRAMYTFTQGVWDTTKKLWNIESKKVDTALLNEHTAIVNAYRTEANEYSREVYSLYAALKAAKEE